MRHAPFLARMADLVSSPRWFDVAAGYHVLRMLDAVFRQEAPIGTTTRDVLTAHVRNATTKSVRLYLLACIQELSVPLDRDLFVIVPFRWYAAWLESVGEGELAADVRETLAGYRERWVL